MRTQLPRLLCVVFLAASCSGHREQAVPEEFPLLVIDVEAARVEERWRAPPRLFATAIDDQTGRVYGISESSDVYRAGDPGPVLWELHPDGPPREVFQLPGLEEEELAVQREYWNDLGAITIDATRRRAVVSSPSSDEISLMDLESETIVASFPVSRLSHGTAVDTATGVGYASSLDGTFSFDLENGALLDTEICADALMPGAIAIASSGVVFVIASPHEVCRHSIPSKVEEILSIPCQHSPDCGFSGAAVWRNDLLAVTAAHSEAIYYPHTLSGGLSLDAPHGIEFRNGGRLRFVSKGLCQRVEIAERADPEVPFSDVWDVPIDGDALGISATSDGSRLYVAQTDPDGVLGMLRWMPWWEGRDCLEPRLKPIEE